MKFLLLILPVLVLGGCYNDSKNIENTMTDCERIAKTSTHIVYKCPSDLEWVQNVKALESSGKWVDWSGLDKTKIPDMTNDTEYTYVEFTRLD